MAFFCSTNSHCTSFSVVSFLTFILPEELEGLGLEKAMRTWSCWDSFLCNGFAVGHWLGHAVDVEGVGSVNTSMRLYGVQILDGLAGKAVIDVSWTGVSSMLLFDPKKKCF